MTDPLTGASSGRPAGEQPAGQPDERPVIRDKRRIDPRTGAVRAAAGSATADTVTAPPQAGGTPNKEEAAMAAPDEKDPTPVEDPVQPAAEPTEPTTTAGEPDGEGDVAAYSSSEGNPVDQPADEQPGEAAADTVGEAAGDAAPAEDVSPDATLAEDLRRDLQRLNAEYVNYKRRVDRDRELHRDLAVSGVVEALLPVLDDIHLARQHGDLTDGPFAAIADKLEATLRRFGVERYGEAGEVFDPNVHEALMHTEAELPEGTEATTVVQVLQPGYRMNERVVRPARVAVADPS